MAQGILRSLVIAHLAWGLVSLLASAASAQTTGQAPDGNPSRDLLDLASRPEAIQQPLEA
jgi:hypothetical protein